MRKCPECGKLLKRVPSSNNLNSEQWDAVKAGDYFCESCPDNGRGQTGLCYWLEREVEAGEKAEIDAMMRE